ncbi:hypothetical protein OQI_18430 [Streptomyces pharetrae CZA14]|uniref:Secreted protein n=1 Tax=Streptomyces pharetrae CZA14 TaxID=1144883 RepID=A0ABX3YGL5_9ACTN|nr:hypothetical protein OQI_18430 [Streptomyces pharetrae CZA14]
MSTGLIVALIVIGVVVVIGAALLMRHRGATGGRDLKRRFGPEYERAVARHDGDTKAAERELTGRLERHGGLRERPLEPALRREYEQRWQMAQERFVDSPRDAVTEADRLLAELAGVRGFPDGGHYEEQLAALSVHHADHVHGYRRVHRIARADGGADGQPEQAATEEMREAMVEARALFEDLVAPARHDTGDRRPPSHARRERTHQSWGFTRHHAKGS